MSELDVHRILCPIDRRERDRLTEQLAQATRIILALRRRLITADPSLPCEYNGDAWAPLERNS